MQLADQINCSVTKIFFKLGIFIDLFEAFDSADYEIQIRRISLRENYL